jgi:hypothetical protein
MHSQFGWYIWETYVQPFQKKYLHPTCLVKCNVAMEENGHGGDDLIPDDHPSWSSERGRRTVCVCSQTFIQM